MMAYSLDWCKRDFLLSSRNQNEWRADTRLLTHVIRDIGSHCGGASEEETKQRDLAGKHSMSHHTSLQPRMDMDGTKSPVQ